MNRTQRKIIKHLRDNQNSWKHLQPIDSSFRQTEKARRNEVRDYKCRILLNKGAAEV